MVPVDPFSPWLPFSAKQSRGGRGRRSGFFSNLFIFKPFSRELPKLVKVTKAFHRTHFFPLSLDIHLGANRNILTILLFRRPPDWLVISTVIIVRLGCSFGHSVILFFFLLEFLLVFSISINQVRAISSYIVQ